MVRHVRAPRSQSVSAKIKQWGLELGFQQVGITDTDPASPSPNCKHGWTNNTTAKWLDGASRYAACSSSRIIARYARVISVRMNYLPANAAFASTRKIPNSAMLAVMRWAVTITSSAQPTQKAGRDDSATLCFADFRPFVDSAPILERPLAEKAVLAGQVSTHLSSIARPVRSSFRRIAGRYSAARGSTSRGRIGKCVACMTICPTGAIVEPYTSMLAAVSLISPSNWKGRSRRVATVNGKPYLRLR